MDYTAILLNSVFGIAIVGLVLDRLLTPKVKGVSPDFEMCVAKAGMHTHAAAESAHECAKQANDRITDLEKRVLREGVK